MLYNLLDADADSDPAFHFGADANPDSDRASKNDADPQLLRNVEEFSIFYSILFCQELRKVDLNAKMSKSKKKKLKKREKRNQQLMEEAMKHAMEAKVIFTQNRIQYGGSGPDPKSDLSSFPLVFRGQKKPSTVSIMLTLYNHRIGINPFSHHQCYGSVPVTFFLYSTSD
jgi:hypothetical protein